MKHCKLSVSLIFGKSRKASFILGSVLSCFVVYIEVVSRTKLKTVKYFELFVDSLKGTLLHFGLFTLFTFRIIT